MFFSGQSVFWKLEYCVLLAAAMSPTVVLTDALLALVSHAAW